jgi:geranylgeranyl diphosphate synthase type I
MITSTSVATSVSKLIAAPIDSDRQRIDRHLDRILSRLRTQFSFRPEFIACADHISEFILNGGKRVRPRLCISLYRILKDLDADSAVPRPLMWVSSSLELFHAFMLVHDDLIDRSPFRRHGHSMHESIRLRSADFGSHAMPEHKAASMALVIGDIMFTVGMSMVTQAGLEGRTARNVHKIISDMLLETGLGQGLDILFEDKPLAEFDHSAGDDDIYQMYLYKTARYTITGPLLIGAAVADARPDLLKALARIGDMLGLAYQVRNDLEDLTAAAAGHDSPDLDTGKRTPILIHTYRNLSALGKLNLARLLDEPPGPNRRNQILSLMESTGSIEHAQKLSERLMVDSLELIQHLPVCPEKRQAIARLASLRSNG